MNILEPCRMPAPQIQGSEGGPAQAWRHLWTHTKSKLKSFFRLHASSYMENVHHNVPLVSPIAQTNHTEEPSIHRARRGKHVELGP